MIARPERFFAERFGLNAGTMERLLGSMSPETILRPATRAMLTRDAAN